MAITLAFGALIYAACVEDDGPDLDALTLRDALGMAPEWLAPRAADERSDLQKRIEAAALQQSEDSTWIELTPEEAAHPLPDDPRFALGRLDLRSLELDRDPLLVAWLELTPEGPIATACPLTDADLQHDDARTGDYASGWALEPAFDRPLAEGSDLTERVALQQRLPMLEAWVARCVEAAGFDLAPDALYTPLTVWRTESAPALLALDPARGVLLLNPILLTLFEPPTEAPRFIPQPPLPTTAQEPEPLRRRADALTPPAASLELCGGGVDTSCCDAALLPLTCCGGVDSPFVFF